MAQLLDAPGLEDNFYLNVVDWSSCNALAVGLGSCVYLWNACSTKVRFSKLIIYLFFMGVCITDCILVEGFSINGWLSDVMYVEESDEIKICIAQFLLF